MLRTEDVFTRMSGMKYFSLLDAIKGYTSLKLMRPTNIKKHPQLTDVFINSSAYQWDWKISKGSWTIWSEIWEWQAALVYIDDLLIFSETFDEHLIALAKVRCPIQVAVVLLPYVFLNFSISFVFCLVILCVAVLWEQAVHTGWWQLSSSDIPSRSVCDFGIPSFRKMSNLCNIPWVRTVLPYHKLIVWRGRGWNIDWRRGPVVAINLCHLCFDQRPMCLQLFSSHRRLLTMSKGGLIPVDLCWKLVYLPN